MLVVSIASFSYNRTSVLKDVRFSLEKGMHLSILGESGCGKSTLLHSIYGLLHLEQGIVRWNNIPLKGPRHKLVPGEDFIKLVAQEFNLMPFTSVGENVATFLDRTDESKDHARIQELLDVVGLTECKHRKVSDLSGGQKQRVALAKALANEPELLLLDEPFSHMDTFRKSTLRRKIYTYLKKKGITCITATHDSEEALAYSDEILILNQGSVEIIGTPEYIYKNIQSHHQGRFFGDINVLPAHIFEPEKSGMLFLFPHQLRISASETKVQVTVNRSYFKGSHYLIEAFWNNESLFFTTTEQLHTDSKVFLTRIPE